MGKAHKQHHDGKAAVALAGAAGWVRVCMCEAAVVSALGGWGWGAIPSNQCKQQRVGRHTPLHIEKVGYVQLVDHHADGLRREAREVLHVHVQPLKACVERARPVRGVVPRCRRGLGLTSEHKGEDTGVAPVQPVKVDVVVVVHVHQGVRAVCAHAPVVRVGGGVGHGDQQRWWREASGVRDSCSRSVE